MFSLLKPTFSLQYFPYTLSFILHQILNALLPCFYIYAPITSAKYLVLYIVGAKALDQ